MTSRSTSSAPWLLVAPAVLLLAWGGNHFTPLIHLYEQMGHYEIWQANLLLGLYVGGLIPGLLIAAAVSDRVGRKPVMVAGALASIAASIVLAVSLDSLVLLCFGRALAGLGVGVAMSVGSSWIKELSSKPFDLKAGITAGARRAALTLTAGFAIGAGITGVLAQWAPGPLVLPYGIHAVLTAISLSLVVAAPESLPRGHRQTGAWWRDLRVPSAGHHKFRRLVMPAAPWVFAAAGVAYAIMPALVQEQLGSMTTVFATLLTVLTLGAGALVQNFVPAINRATGGHALPMGLALMTVGMALAVVAALFPTPWMVMVVAIVLGVAYGICLVSGLIHTQSIATPEDLAGLTGVYYALTYTGFLLPTVLAALLPIASYAVSLSAVAVICLLCLAQVWRVSRQQAA